MSNRKLGTFKGTVTRINPRKKEHSFWLPFDARARVKRGAELLDRHYGRDWAKKINLQRLDISDGHASYSWGPCALTQVYGSYSDGVLALSTGKRDFETETYGFGFTGSINSFEGLLENLALVTAFRAEVSARLA